jgi:6,7-dimethyl-8-ribityllumazine synthase
MRDHRGALDGSLLRIALVVSRFNESVTRGLQDGALDELRTLGVPAESVTLCEVPGALEIPIVALSLARSGRHDAIVALGAVIRGETDHYTHVCAETTRGCGAAALSSGVPVAFGVLTCETLAQARERSGAGPKNKGREAVRAAVETANLLAALQEQAPS